MNHLYSNIIGAKVYEIETNLILAKVREVVISLDTGDIKAFLVQTGFFPFYVNKILQPRDITRWTTNIYIQERQDLSLPEDIVRLRNIYNEYISLYRLPVYTENDTSLGVVLDYQVSDISNELIELRVGSAPIFMNSVNGYLSIRKKDIVKIEKTLIVVKDLYLKQIVEEIDSGECTPEPTY